MLNYLRSKNSLKKMVNIKKTFFVAWRQYLFSIFFTISPIIHDLLVPIVLKSEVSFF